MIPIVIGALGTVTKGFERRLVEDELRPFKLQISQSTEKSPREDWLSFKLM